MVWCEEHQEYHKGKVRKFACSYAKRQGIQTGSFKAWFNNYLPEMKEAQAIEAEKKRREAK